MSRAYVAGPRKAGTPEGVIYGVVPRPRHSCGVVLRRPWSRYAAKSST